MRDKDALDVLRLLRAIDAADLVEGLSRLRGSDVARQVTAESIGLLPRLFGDVSAEGVKMAVRAAGESEDAATIAASLIALVDDLLLLVGTDIR